MRIIESAISLKESDIYDNIMKNLITIGYAGQEEVLVELVKKLLAPNNQNMSSMKRALFQAFLQKLTKVERGR